MNSKHDTLTEAELKNYKLRAAALNLIDECSVRLGISPKELRILDWGCGRGRTVANLLEMGIDAYGVDIDPEPINNGYALFNSRGAEPENRLICIDPNCLTPFPDGFFNIVVSDQVIEHVSHLNDFVTELSRITAYDGAGLHNFPAKWCIVEPHLFVPFLHWLPKNRLRLWYLRLLLFKVPTWKGLESKSSKKRAKVYYDYSVQKTYYRSLSMICQSFSQQGFNVNVRPTGSAKRSHNSRLPSFFFNNRYPKKICTWWSKSFKTVEITARRIKTNDNI